MEKFVSVKEIWQIDKKTLGITWTDIKESRYNVAELRRKCPCAQCVDENSGKRLLDPKKVDDQIHPIMIKSVGRYALNIQFSDHHNTGIYTFNYLRSL